MTNPIDGLASPTIKNLRERWWDDEFTEFLAETLKPRPGNRILDVGCGRGQAEVAIGRLHISQIRLFGIDLSVSKVIEAKAKTRSHNHRVGFAAADTRQLPFADGSFDAVFCVAVLQHVNDVDAAVAECARVCARNGRIVAVEPDNGAHYWYSSIESGQTAFEHASRLFAAQERIGAVRSDLAVGPRLAALFHAHDVEPLDVRLFPVSAVQLGPPPEDVWVRRRQAAEKHLEATDSELRSAARDYLVALEAYRTDAAAAGATLVEIQHTMLFATVGQRL